MEEGEDCWCWLKTILVFNNQLKGGDKLLELVKTCFCWSVLFLLVRRL